MCNCDTVLADWTDEGSVFQTSIERGIKLARLDILLTAGTGYGSLRNWYPDIARNFWHLRDCALPSRVREPTADCGRWSSQRCAGIQYAVVDREEEEKRSVLYQELSLARKPFLYIYIPWFPLHPSLDDLFFCLFVEVISLSPRRRPGVGTHSIGDSLLSSSIFFSVSFVLKRVQERRAFVQSTHELQRLWIYHKLCSLKADAIDKTIRKASTDPEKQANFLKDFSPLSRKTSTLEKTVSYCEKTWPRREQTQQSWKEM